MKGQPGVRKVQRMQPPYERYVAAIAVAVCVMLFTGVIKPMGSVDSHQYSAVKGDIGETVEREVRTQLQQAVKGLQESGKQVYPKVAHLAASKKMRILVTGGAGFVGSHLVDRLMYQGHDVIVMDNLFTGARKNIQHWIGHPHFQFIVHDVTEPILLEVDRIFHLACPASPPHYQYNPIKTLKTSTLGTVNMLGLAKRVRARILFTSTSEIYGDPKENPQKESYWGNVNPIGPRACYDEGKRVAETLMYAYQAQSGVDVRVARIFNTFGPRMNPYDGRVVSNFIIQAIQGKDVTIYGDGKATRSFQYVDDLVNGLLKLMDSDYDQPCNLGNPDEFTIKEFAELIVQEISSNSSIINRPATKDDPQQRRPDISVAKEHIGWQPMVTVREGLSHTIKYFKKELQEVGEIDPTGPGQFAAVNKNKQRTAL